MQQNRGAIRPTSIGVLRQGSNIYNRLDSVNSPSSRPEMHGAWRLLLSLLCIFLVIACGTIQVVHVHPQGDLSHSDCALCVTAHVTVQLAETPVTLNRVAPVISAVEALVAPTLAQTASTFALFTRPPPVDAPLS